MSYSMASGGRDSHFFFKDVVPDRLIVLLRVTPYSEAQIGVNGILKILMKGHKVKGREVGVDPRGYSQRLPVGLSVIIKGTFLSQEGMR